jgi:hypothetical protein
MNEEEVFNRFMKIAGDCSTMSPYEQAMEVPRRYMNFFKSIYTSGFNDGFEKGKIACKTEISKKN